jgi:hypothetical protein
MKALLALFSLVLFCAACPSPGSYKGTFEGVSAQDGYPLLQSGQPCIDSQVVVSKMDKVMLLLRAELIGAGIVKDEAAFDKLGKSSIFEGPRWIGCLIEEPAPCSAGGYTLGPCKGVNPAAPPCARKRGCAVARAFWVSKNWPPVAKAEWPEEPHAVKGKDDPLRTSDYDADLVHEVLESVGAMLDLSVAGHQSAYYSVIGVNVLKAYLGKRE